MFLLNVKINQLLFILIQSKCTQNRGVVTGFIFIWVLAVTKVWTSMALMKALENWVSLKCVYLAPRNDFYFHSLSVLRLLRATTVFYLLTSPQYLAHSKSRSKYYGWMSEWWPCLQQTGPELNPALYAAQCFFHFFIFCCFALFPNKGFNSILSKCDLSMCEQNIMLWMRVLFGGKNKCNFTC